MTDTTHTQPIPPGRTARERSPEFRFAVDALRGLWQDLFHDAFAYRPLPPTEPGGRFTRSGSARMREYGAWAPHAAVIALAGLSVFVTLVSTWNGGPFGLLCALLVGAPVVLTLSRPVGAFWIALAANTVALFLDGGDAGESPWLPGAFLAHLAVVTLVAMRTRPRTASWMWLLTAVYGFSAYGLFDRSDYYGHTSDLGPMLFLTGVALLIVSVRQTLGQARREVSVHRTVTAHERSQRTLLEERTTIARELHDVVAHHMSVVAIQAEAAPYRVENPPPELEKAFAIIRENAVAALTELRRVLGVVRAEDYEAPDAPQPTLADLDALLANVRDAGLDVTRTVTGAVRELPQGVELSAYRIVQEALSNTLRHAPGADARVEIGYVLGGLGLRVVNGAPPAPSLIKPSPGAGHGITGMRERVSMLNGEMTAAPTAEGGYEVAVFLPVPAASPAEGDA
ncbi:sensor histidine kinase [Streptomyces seoulensis]|uniref:sensor histidine kinase n=1 Tax=Streptomyces seoulensis TaxID=73044 RepID=UPI0036775617